MREGQVFVANGWQRPDGLCESAWQTISPFVMTLAHGGTDLYDGWMKNPASAMISCTFAPISDRASSQLIGAKLPSAARFIG